jgi:hypothetical protein
LLAGSNVVHSLESICQGSKHAVPILYVRGLIMWDLNMRYLNVRDLTMGRLTREGLNTQNPNIMGLHVRHTIAPKPGGEAR